MKHPVIAIIGAGNVGATTAYALMLKNLVAEILLIDTNTTYCDGQVRDLADALSFSRTSIIRSATYQDARLADIIIICAGAPQQPDQSRTTLLKDNICIIRSLFKNLRPLKPESLVIMVSNPVDILTSVALQESGLPANQVFGSGTWLDTLRLKRYLSQHLTVAENAIDALVLGEHGDSQFVAWSLARVGSTPLSAYPISKEELDAIAEKTKNEAYLIIQEKKATYYGIAACVAKLCQACLFNERIIVPVSSYQPDLGVCLSLPVVLGEQGVEQSVETLLCPKEQQQLALSAHHLQKLLATTRC